MKTEPFRLSQFAVNVLDSIDRHVPEEEGVTRAAIVGIFQILRAVAVITHEDLDATIRDLVCDQLRQGHEQGYQSLSEFARGISARLDSQVSDLLKPLFSTLFTHLESLAEWTSTSLDVRILAILNGVLDPDEAENQVAV